MRFNLAAMVKGRRKPIVDIRPIKTTLAQSDDLVAIYLRMLAPLERAADFIMSAYERELGRKLQTDSAADVGDDAGTIAKEINRLILELTPDLRAWALRVERVHRSKWSDAVRTALQVIIDTMIGPDDMAETIGDFLVRNTSLIRDVNEQARGRIADAVLRGIQQRTPGDKVAKEIADAGGMARARAKRIARHQTVSLGAALNEERRRQAGLDTWRWRHSGKLHPRPIHKARDGNLYTDETAPEDKPGVLPNCGCVAQAVLILPE